MPTAKYRDIEHNAMEARSLHGEIIAEIASHLHKEQEAVHRAVYQASITTASRPLELANIINEFLVFLLGEERERKQEEES